MDVYQAIKIRRSVRAYQEKEVPEEKLNSIMKAVRLAPSASNRQDYKFVIVKEKETRQKLARACAGQMFIAEAPVVIVAVSLKPNDVMSCQVPRYAIDIAIAVDHLTLAAAGEGLGTCWIGAFNQEEARKIIGVSEECKVVTVIPLGYPADKPGSKARKDLTELICRERFRQ